MKIYFSKRALLREWPRLHEEGMVPTGRFFATVPCPLLESPGRVEGEWSRFDSGWNGSYHDAAYSEPQMVVAAPTLVLLRIRVKEIRKRLAIAAKQDAAVARFRARQAVRPGD